jgi:hypothetical protein
MSAAEPLVPAASGSADLLVVGSMLSDVGLVRSINEDSVTFVVPSEGKDPENRSGLLLVARSQVRSQPRWCGVVSSS